MRVLVQQPVEDRGDLRAGDVGVGLHGTVAVASDVGHVIFGVQVGRRVRVNGIRGVNRVRLWQEFKDLLGHVGMAVCRGMDVFDEIVPERIVHQRREFIDFGVGHFGDEVFGGAGALKADIAVHLSDSGIRHPADRDQRFTGQLQVAEWIVHTDGDDRCVRIQLPDARDDRIPVFLEHGLAVEQGVCQLRQHQRGDAERFCSGKNISGELAETAKPIELLGNGADDTGIRYFAHICAEPREGIRQRIV